jgi:hypothetical protein
MVSWINVNSPRPKKMGGGTTSLRREALRLVSDPPGLRVNRGAEDH